MKRIICLLAFLASLATAVESAEPEGGQVAREMAALPLSAVILYTSGVGYFQRDGQVEGDARLDLRFKTDDINDLLKSLVVQDFDGGQVATVTYDSRDPISKTLKSFGIDLTTSPGLGGLLGQIRGERVEVATPARVTGTVLGVETKKKPADEDKVVEVEYLNLMTEEGLRSLPLDQVQRVKLLNERLDAELRQALEVLAAGHDTQKKTVSIRFEGQGKRRVSVAYIAAAPVWKTSYRLVLGEKEKPFLQGWAIVENTTDDDWDDVRLSLISGRPISFTMDLYQPLYVPRPLVEPELYASLRPQVYGQEMEDAKKFVGAVAADVGPVERRSARGRMMAPMAVAPAPVEAAPRNQDLGIDLKQGVASAAQGIQAGELFQYAIKTPVSLARQKSAMLPVLSQGVEGKKVSIYNESVNPQHPLNGFRLKNTTALYLMQGPITVFDDDAYAGDARIEDLAPGQDRLISYALDLKVEVEPQAQGGQQELVAVKLRRGTLIATRKHVSAKLYIVRNRDRKARDVLVEHPFRDGWNLVEPSEPAERTREVYRFDARVEPDKTTRLLVREEQQTDELFALTNLEPDRITLFLRSRIVGDRVKEALQKVVQLRDRLARTQADRARLQQRAAEIDQEQSRIRENLGKLAQNSDLYNRYIKKLDQQETELDDLRPLIEKLKDVEASQQRELDDYLLGLDIDG
ncbi:MAG: hypothetical protein JOZ53_14880 [Planctomycetaceae bacterium]|nr:hypothetical protein [Planctomycetaceae bacterium]